MFELNRLIKDPTCFKSSNPSCIDNFYTNFTTMFFNSSTVGTGISDHHSLICIMVHSTFCEGPSKFIYYRSYRYTTQRSSENWQNYKRQCNICSNILRSTKKTFFEALNINEINDNKKFWKTVKPFFTDK